MIDPIIISKLTCTEKDNFFQDTFLMQSTNVIDLVGIEDVQLKYHAP